MLAHDSVLRLEEHVLVELAKRSKKPDFEGIRSVIADVILYLDSVSLSDYSDELHFQTCCDSLIVKLRKLQSNLKDIASQLDRSVSGKSIFSLLRDWVNAYHAYRSGVISCFFDSYMMDCGGES